MTRQTVQPLAGGVPSGGAINQVLAKSSASDYAVGWVAQSGGGLTLPLTQTLTFSPDSTFDIGAVATTRPRDLFLGRNALIGGNLTVTGTILGNGAVPSGGTTNQVLVKGSNVSYDAAWQTPFSQATADARYLQLAGGTLTGNLLFSTDNLRDIGASGATRPRDLFLGRNLTVGGTITGNGSVPAGGTSGQVLTKSSATDYALSWTTPSGGALSWPLAAPGGSVGAPSYSFATDTTSGLWGAGTNGSYDVALNASRYLNFITAGITRWQMNTGHWYASADSLYDIGASGTARPRYVYAGSGVIAPLVSSPLVQSTGALQLASLSVARWRIHTNGDLWAETDNANDIGASAGSRPRDLFLARNLTAVGEVRVGNPVGGRLYVATGSTPALILKNDTATTGITQISGQMQASMTANAYWTGTGWARITTGSAATLDVNVNGTTLYYAPSAGAAVPPAFASVWSADTTGMSVTGKIAASGEITAGTFRHGYLAPPSNGYTGTTWSTLYICTTPGWWFYLPPGAGRAGDYVIVKNWSGGVVTVSASGGQVIGLPGGGSPASHQLNSGESYTYMSDGGAGMMVIAKAV